MQHALCKHRSWIFAVEKVVWNASLTEGSGQEHSTTTQDSVTCTIKLPGAPNAQYRLWDASSGPIFLC